MPPPYLLWPRNLTDEAAYFNQYDSDPVYLSAPTLMCYDCHENQANEVENPVDPDNWPTNSTYGVHASGTPQDISLDDYDEENKLQRSQGSGDVGYYEMLDGSLPSIPAQSDATGGHYWKRTDANLSGTPEVKQGEKLSCALCHDVHDIGTQQVLGESQAMFRTEYWDGSAWNTYPVGNLAYGQGNGALYSSTNTRAHGDESPGNNNHGRNLCSACHGYSDQGAAVDMYGDTIPSPPPFISAHSTSSTTACTSCHEHNKIVFRCDQCHGFPPLVDNAAAGGFFDSDLRPTAESYTGGAGAHQRHLDALGTDIFKCEICHGPHAGVNEPNLPTPEVWHNEGGGTVSRDKVDIMGESAWWDPAGTLTTAYVGTQTGAVASVPTDYEFTAKGADDGGGTGGRCDNLECHGRPPATEGALNWNDDMVDDTTGAAVTIAICEWCHDATPAVLDLGAGAVGAPNAMGDGTTFGSRVNGHSYPTGSGNKYEGDAVGEGTRTGLAAANKECTVCHDATYTEGVGPDKDHFDEAYGSTEKRLNDTINSQAVTDSDDTCIACHQNAGGDAGTQISSHGNTPTPPGYTKLEADFQRHCRSCHEPHGLNWNGTGRNLHMIGKWLDDSAGGTWGTPEAGEEARVDSNASGLLPAVNITAVADNAVVFTSRTGLNSFNDKQGTPSDDICQTCHGAGTGGGDHSGSTNFSSDERENDCTNCHSHDYDDTVVTYIYDAFLPKGGPDIEQFFDNTASSTNYNDFNDGTTSRHSLNIGSLDYPNVPDCIGCHQTDGGSGTSNECIDCHREGHETGGTWTWDTHLDGNVELRTAGTPPYSIACTPGTDCISIAKRTTDNDLGGINDVADHCLACHDSNLGTALNLSSDSPPNIVPSGSAWDGGFGHGSSTTLSSERSGAGHNAGPPTYDCTACHYSTIDVGSGQTLKDIPPSFHASINIKLIANTTGPYQTTQYTDWPTGQTWCLTECHRTVASGKQVNGDNSVGKDDKVIDHTWSTAAPFSDTGSDQTDCPLTGDPTAGICETHPSWDVIDDASPIYRYPPALPYDTSTDRFTCISCHEPHGNSGALDADQMIRIDYSDGTICGQCHE
ncbi:hypothetical protein N9903_00645 [bacterium]|nr:hypothetical protein [bacterium]